MVPAMIRLPIFASLALLLTLSAPAETAPAAPPATKDAAAKTPGRGLVWKIEGGKAPVYLAGSFHLLRKDDLPYPSTLEAAFEASEQIWFEVPPGDMGKPGAAAKILALGMLPADKSLKDVIPAETHGKVEKWVADNPSLGPVLDRMRPWLVAMTIMLTEYQRMGVGPEHGIENAFMTRAEKEGKKTGGFETVEQQLSFFGELTPDRQQALLDKTFEDLAQSKEQLTGMIANWKAGNEKDLAAEMNKSFEGHDDLKKRLLDDRNAAWIEPIEKFLAADTPTLVIVGAGHLAGNGSVVDLLEKKGWKLTRVEPANP